MKKSLELIRLGNSTEARKLLSDAKLKLKLFPLAFQEVEMALSNIEQATQGS